MRAIRAIRSRWNRLSLPSKLLVVALPSALLVSVLLHFSMTRPLGNGTIGAAPSPPPTSTAPSPSETSYYTVTVHYGTNRRDEASAGSPPTFGRQFSNAIAYGHAEISIPRNHLVGAIERPTWWKLDFHESPDRHIVVLKTIRSAKKSFLESLSREAPDASKGQILIFVHGFNVGFDDAARRTGQMKFDLDFPGPVAFFSWPSQNALSPQAYLADRELASASRGLVEQFISEIASQQWAKELYLVAHSMGTHSLTEAIASIGEKRLPFVHKIREIILAAPDIDANLFSDVIAPSLVKTGAAVTMYVSKDDVALRESKRLRGNFSRIGDASTNVFVATGFETIDATGIDTSLLGHSYYTRHPFLADMASLVRDRKRANDRFYLRRAPQGTYWSFKALPQ